MLASCGCYAFKLAESGVMGMHRIVQNLDAVKAADVVICITGMVGVGGWVDGCMWGSWAEPIAVKAADVVICITGMVGGRWGACVLAQHWAWLFYEI